MGVRHTTGISAPHLVAWGLAAGMGFGALDVALTWIAAPGFRPWAMLALTWAVSSVFGVLGGLLLAGLLRALRLLASPRSRLENAIPNAGPVLVLFTCLAAVLDVHILQVRASNLFSAGVLLPNSILLALLGLSLRSLSGERQSKFSLQADRLRRSGIVVAACVATLSGLGLVEIYRQAQALHGSAEAGTATDQPSVIWLVLDTMRADALSCYDAQGVETDAIDAVAANGVRFENAYSAASWTLPSHASMLTGTHPTTHGMTGVVALYDGVHHFAQRTLAETSAADVFREAGYATAAFSENPWISASTGIGRGFDIFDDVWNMSGRRFTLLERSLKFAQTRGWMPWTVSALTVASIQRWLRDVEAESPFFLFVNFLDAHAPYTPTHAHRRAVLGDTMIPETVSRVAADPLAHVARQPTLDEDEMEILRGLYDAEVAFLDDRIGDLMAFLERSGILQNAIIVITSDHGENFGWQGLASHAFSLNEDLVRIPLIIHAPGRIAGGRTVTTPVSLVDLLPTLVELARVPLQNPERLEGLSLLPLLGSGDADHLEQRTLFAEESVNEALLNAARKDYPDVDWGVYERALKVARRGNLKYVWSSDGQHSFFDLGADPAESEDLIRSRADQAEAMALELQDWVRGLQSKPQPPMEESVTLDAETLETLRTLGYIE